MYSIDKVLEWINSMNFKGLLCKDYMDRTRIIKNTNGLFKMLCDANGISFLQELEMKGEVIPYQLFLDTFKYHINGKDKPKYYCNDSYYDSSYYCSLYGDKYNRYVNIDITTTLVGIMNCDVTLNIPKDKFVRICVNKRSDIVLNVGDGANVLLELYGTKCVKILNNKELVNIKDFSKDERYKL